MRQVSLSSFLFSSSRSFAFISFHILPSIPAYDSLRYLLAFAFSSAQPTLEPRSSLTRGKTNFKNQPSPPPPLHPPLLCRMNFKFLYILAIYLQIFHISHASRLKIEVVSKGFWFRIIFFFFFQNSNYESNLHSCEITRLL